ILQRRLASSMYALYQSLNRRKRRLEDMLAMAELPEARLPETDFDIVEDLSEEDRWKQEEIWETLSVAENRAELEQEIATLDRLLAQAKRIINEDREIKLNHFRESLAG